MYNEYVINFIEVICLIKKCCLGVKVSGGVSNISFFFWGNNVVWEVMYVVFFYYVIKVGMDMGIVNVGMIEVYDEIFRDLLEWVEDVFFN